jgi:hypothetical protein
MDYIFAIFNLSWGSLLSFFNIRCVGQRRMFHQLKFVRGENCDVSVGNAPTKELAFGGKYCVGQRNEY